MRDMNKGVALVEVATAHVTALRLTGLDNLDPITVYLDNPEPGRGWITIRCWDACWAAGWPSMAGRRVEEFFVERDDHYLAKALSSTPAEVAASGEALIRSLRAELLRRIRDRYMDKDLANRCWEMLDEIEIDDDDCGRDELMTAIFGVEWFRDPPTMPNPDYLYLCRIIQAVRDGLRKYIEEKD